MLAMTSNALIFILNGALVFTLFILSAIYFASIFKVIIFSEIKFFSSFKITLKEEKIFHLKKFFKRLFLELKPKIDKQIRASYLSLLLLTKSLFCLFLGLFLIVDKIFIEIFAIVFVILIPIILLKYIDKMLKDC